MNYGQHIMACQSCTSRKELEHQLHIAENVRYRLNSLILRNKCRGFVSNRSKNLFNADSNCSQTGNSCSKYMEVKRKLESTHEEVSRQHDMLKQNLVETKTSSGQHFESLKKEMLLVYGQEYVKAHKDILAV